jgi:putative acetyltransferase
MEIRGELPIDQDAIRDLHLRAFPTDSEALLVDRLHEGGAVCLSLVATVEERVVGHILFSIARIDRGSGEVLVGALGPIAVLPEWQRQGIGSALIRAGLEQCWGQRLPAVIVLGHPDYYTRFGFHRADTWGIQCEFDVPPEVFMMVTSSELGTEPGLALYHPAFGAM